MDRKPKGHVFVIDGSRFDDLNGFYDEVSRELMGGMAEPFEREPGKSYISLDPTYWGRNLDAFDDILLGDMGVMPGRGVPFTIVWRNAARSRELLADRFGKLVEILRDHEQITLRLE